ncbi:hypothetical protein [Methylobacterium sp. J-092]|nr:hypothetical protein [Methylobacterium sp. J-092]
MTLYELEAKYSGMDASLERELKPAEEKKSWLSPACMTMLH